MNVTFGHPSALPEKYVPGKIYFVEGEGAIYVAVSETEIVQYSAYKDLEKLSTSKQDVIEDLETIRTEATKGASLAQNFSVISTDDIDILFENN